METMERLIMDKSTELLKNRGLRNLISKGFQKKLDDKIKSEDYDECVELNRKNEIVKEKSREAILDVAKIKVPKKS